MANVLILGAGGQIAQQAIAMMAGARNLHLTLFARNPKRLKAHAEIVQGDVLDGAKLKAAVAGKDIVYANLTGADSARI